MALAKQPQAVALRRLALVVLHAALAFACVNLFTNVLLLVRALRMCKLIQIQID